MNLQTIVSCRLSPNDIGVVSVTELITDGTRNASPGLARILGDARSFRAEISAEIEKQMRVIVEGTGRTYDVAVEVNYTREFVPCSTIPSWSMKPLLRPAQCSNTSTSQLRASL
jgi:metal-dependent amidase/aminoacylase/carboxypeptidase family protein